MSGIIYIICNIFATTNYFIGVISFDLNINKRDTENVIYSCLILTMIFINISTPQISYKSNW